MATCPICGYNEKVSNTLQATVMNKFKDQHGNQAVFNKPNDLKTFETIIEGEKFVWTKIETGNSRSSIVGQAINSKQAEVLAEINASKVGTLGGSNLPIMATATPEGESPANGNNAQRQLTYDELQALQAKVPVQTVGITQPTLTVPLTKAPIIVIQPPTK